MIINIKKMIKKWLEKFCISLKTCKKFIHGCCTATTFDKIFAFIESIGIGITHIKNITIILFAYALVSTGMRGEFNIALLRELFTLICAYVALCLWFPIIINDAHKICALITICISPIVFIHSNCFVGVVSIILLLLLQYVLLENARVRHLFSDLVPVYIVTDLDRNRLMIDKMYSQYKILEIIQLSQKDDFSKLRSLLNTVSKMSFFPYPRKILYVYKKFNTELARTLIVIAGEHAISVLKVCVTKDNLLTSAGVVSLYDFDKYEVNAADRKLLFDAFSGKRVWIHYDGRACILSLVRSMLPNLSLNLTIICDNEQLAKHVREYFVQTSSNAYRIKVLGVGFFGLQDTGPDVLFYNVPVRSFDFGDDNLKEVVSRNILEIGQVIEFAKKSKVGMTFFVTDTGALDVGTWVGATKRVGEVMCQKADDRNNRFMVIRLPECLSDFNGVYDHINYSASIGIKNINFLKTTFDRTCYQEDVMPLFIKSILMAIESAYTTIHTVIPDRCAVVSDVETVLSGIYLTRGFELALSICDTSCECVKEIDAGDKLSESTETNIYISKYDKFAKGAEITWSFESVKGYTKRDLIAAVYTSLAMKVRK